MKILQRPRQLWRCLRQGQTYRNDGAFALHELVQKCLNLLILPRAKAPVAHKNRCRFYIFILSSKRRLPRRTRPDLVVVRPRLDGHFDQLLGDLTDGWLILAAVTQEYVKNFRLGVLSIHPEAILFGPSIVVPPAAIASRSVRTSSRRLLRRL
jgi:hypothetical protein